MKVKAYIEWLKHNWDHLCLILAIYAFILLFGFVRSANLIVFLILLNVPIYFLHQTEEYVFPGGFQKFFNLHIFKSGREDAPMGTNFIFFVNIFATWVILPLFGLLAFSDPIWGLWIPYFSIFAGLGHVALGIKSRQKYNPGLVVSLLLNIPYGIGVVCYFAKIGLLANPWMNVHFLIGLGLNLLLPVVGVILYKRYQASLSA